MNRTLTAAGLAVATAVFAGAGALSVLGAGTTGGQGSCQDGAVFAQTSARGLPAWWDMAGQGAERNRHAATIIAVGRAQNVPPRGWAVALATAIQESRLINLAGGDRDSLGLFQQRPSQGWGTPQQIQTPRYAAAKFYAGLLAVPDWELMPVTVAAQTVQRSAFPDAYAQWEGAANLLVRQLGDVAVNPVNAECGTASNAALTGNSVAERAVNAALSQANHAPPIPYSWGGGGFNGPSEGFAQGAGLVGFDCSGLMQYAWWQAGKVRLPRTAREQANATVQVSRDDIRAGDLLFFYGYSHVGIYDGRGGMVEAPSTGKNLRVTPNVFTRPYYRDGLDSIRRVTTTTSPAA